MDNDNNSKGCPLERMLTVLVRISNRLLNPVFFFTFFAFTGKEIIFLYSFAPEESCFAAPVITNFCMYELSLTV